MKDIRESLARIESRLTGIEDTHDMLIGKMKRYDSSLGDIRKYLTQHQPSNKMNNDYYTVFSKVCHLEKRIGDVRGILTDLLREWRGEKNGEK